jgi:hypothetical protein
MTTALAAYDEAVAPDGRLRPAYAELARRLGRDPLAWSAVAHPFADATPVAAVPLALDDREYREVVQAGVVQRALALQACFAAAVLGDDDPPAELDDVRRRSIAALAAAAPLARLRRLWRGRTADAVCFTFAADLVRDRDGRWLVLEDNVGCVGGAADAHALLAGLAPPGAPDLAVAVRRWLAAHGDGEAVAVVADAAGDRRFREDERRARLLRELGVPLVDGRLPERATAIVNLGAHAAGTWSWLDRRFARDGAALLNAPGTGALGTKALLPLMDDLIRHHLHEPPRLASPPTIELADSELPAEPEDWVVKAAGGCGGHDVHVLRWDAPPAPPPGAIAQRYVEPSRLAGRVVELRAFAHVVGAGRVVAGEQAIAKLVPDRVPRPLHHISAGAVYAPVVRVPIRG